MKQTLKLCVLTLGLLFVIYGKLHHFCLFVCLFFVCMCMCVCVLFFFKHTVKPGASHQAGCVKPRSTAILNESTFVMVTRGQTFYGGLLKGVEFFTLRLLVPLSYKSLLEAKPLVKSRLR